MTTEETIMTKADEPEEVPGLTKDEVIELINEYMAEKEETIATEITEKVESQLEAIVEAKVQELTNNEPEEDPADETKADPPEEQEEEVPEDEEEEPEEETKSFSPEMITDAINKGIAEYFNDDFVDKVASKMFNNLDQTRTTKGSKFEQYKKQMQNEPTETPVEKSTYSTKETAEILLKKQQAANPIMAAAMKNLQ